MSSKGAPKTKIVAPSTPPPKGYKPSGIYKTKKIFGAWQYWNTLLPSGDTWEEWYLFGFRVKRNLIHKGRK